jgi:Shedu protein SduA, C-terminal
MARPDSSAPQDASGEDVVPTLLPGSFVFADTITEQEAAAYDQALATAPDEAAMQRFLEANPRLLVQHLGGGHGRWVIPKTRLGAEHETDFLIAEKDATGFVWHAVELERPQAKLFTQKGDPSAALTHALRQIADWRNWLSHNRDYAMRPRGQSGLGLLDIEPELDGLIIMGREAELDPRTNPLRRRLARVNRVRIETYDWLSRQARARLAALERSRGPALNDNQRFMVNLLDSVFSNPTPEKPAKRAVREVFGDIATSWHDVSATREIEWESVVFEFDPDPDNNIYVPLNIVPVGRQDMPLTMHDWNDWTKYVARDLDLCHSLLVSERPPDEELRATMTEECEGVWYEPYWYRWTEEVEPSFHRVDVLVYLPPTSEQSDRVARLSAARELLLHYLPEPDHVPDERHMKR